MTYFNDLSEYKYTGMDELGTKNVGWLDAGRDFPQQHPDEEILDLVWAHCAVSVIQTRGLHICELCRSSTSCNAERKDERLLLGSAEIRVFSSGGDIYAAPNLIYHYMSVHHYKPPDEFLAALREGPRPLSQKYFERLSDLRLEWNKTLVPSTDGSSFRFEKTDTGVKVVKA
jgi:hypothetical protein